MHLTHLGHASGVVSRLNGEKRVYGLKKKVLRTYTAAYSISVLKQRRTTVNLFLTFFAVPPTTALRIWPNECETGKPPESHGVALCLFRFALQASGVGLGNAYGSRRCPSPTGGMLA